MSPIYSSHIEEKKINLLISGKKKGSVFIGSINKDKTYTHRDIRYYR